MTQQRSLLLFEQAIKSEATKKAYLYHLNKFKKWSKIKDFNGLLQAPQKDIQILLEDYVMYLKNTVSPNSIPIYFAPIELFYIMNDVNLNFKKIRKLFPEKIKKGNERGYTQKDIQTILINAKTKRHKALVLLFASSGIRLGAIPEIQLHHLTKIEDSYAIKIYDGEKEEDFVFTTPECTKAIDEYLLERESDGDTVTTTITGITQDEPTPGPGKKHSPDGDGVGTDTAEIRAERDGSGDGRVYEISFTADDGNDGMCTGSVQVEVPHDQSGDPAVDSGQDFDSTIP